MSTLSTVFHEISDRGTAGPSRVLGLINALRHEIRLRRALREVEALDDAALLDIGISRGGLEDAVRFGRR